MVLNPFLKLEFPGELMPIDHLWCVHVLIYNQPRSSFAEIKNDGRRNRTEKPSAVLSFLFPLSTGGPG